VQTGNKNNMRVERYIRIPVNAAHKTANRPPSGLFRPFRKALAGFFVFVVAMLFLGTLEADAATYGYEAREVSRSANVVEMTPGGTADFSITFENTSYSTWRTAGNSRFVSVYTYGPKYRDSAFKDAAWHKDVQPAVIDRQVGPGERGTLRFRLHAPSNSGTYSETFHLAAEDLLWIPGGQFTVQIKVSAPVAVATPASTTYSSSSYGAQELYRSPQGTINMQPGEVRMFTIGMKNTGSSTWYPNTTNYVSAYTYEPKYRKSAFEDVSWYDSVQPSRISSHVTPPGQMGEIKMMLRAPSNPGVYRETFHLAAEDLTWIPGGKFTVSINVGGSSSAPSEPVAETSLPDSSSFSSVPAGGYAAVRMASSTDSPALDPGEITEVRLAFKNVGSIPWVSYGSEPVRLVALSGNAESFRDSSWTGDFAANMMQERIGNGQLAFFNLRLKAPQVGGAYLARFALYAGERPIEGGSVDVPIEVKQGSVAASVPVNTTSEFAASSSRGPNIRVGLFKTTAPVVVASSGTYQLIDGSNHQSVKQLSGTTSVTFDFSTLTYTVRNGAYTYTSNYHVHRGMGQDPQLQQVPRRPVSALHARYRQSLGYRRVADGRLYSWLGRDFERFALRVSESIGDRGKDLGVVCPAYRRKAQVGIS
jgi:hypothetical protein